MSNIRIDIASEFKDKGFKKADKAASALDARFERLGRTILTVFSVQQVTRFAKAAVEGFKEDERAAVRFEQALKGVNLGFAAPEINTYLDTLEKQTGILKDDLMPAYQSLAQTTRSVFKSQDILNTAIDTAAGTGIDLNTVVRDLTRSYVGNNAGLTKYNLGLSKTELKTTSFAKVQQLLNNQFSGQRAAYLETYAGKTDMLRVSYDLMSDSIGEGLVDAFGMLAGENGIGGATTAMEKFGVAASDAIRGIGVLISTVQTRIPLLDQLQYLSQFPQVMTLIDKLMDLGANQRPLFFPTAGIGKPGVDARLAAIEEAAIKRQKELEALRLKNVKAQEKANRLKRISIMLMEKEKKFDITRAQLAAALQGKLTAEEENRVRQLMLIEEIKQAITEQDVEKAEKLMDELQKLKTETQLLAESLIDLKAGNPFSGWDDYFKSANGLVNDLFKNFKSQSAVLTDLVKSIKDARDAANAAVLAAKTDKATAYAQAAEASANSAALATTDAANAVVAATNALASATTPEETASAQNFLDAANAAVDAAAILTESLSAADLATALAEAALAEEYLNQSMEAASNVGLVPETNITVNVAGSVITELDLAEALVDTIYLYQRAGKPITLQNLAI